MYKIKIINYLFLCQYFYEIEFLPVFLNLFFLILKKKLFKNWRHFSNIKQIPKFDPEPIKTPFYNIL